MDANSNNNSALARLGALLRKDPKKTTILSVLTVVMALMWVKLFTGGATPAVAGAAPVAAAAASGVSTDKIHSVTSEHTAFASGPLEPPTRNLFKIDYDRYQQSGKTTTAGANVQAADNDSKQKSPPTPTDLKKERQILVANLQELAAKLKLQTTVMGVQPKALIDGNVVHEGDVVGSFRVVRISPRGVVIEREGIKLEVQMK